MNSTCPPCFQQVRRSPGAGGLFLSHGALFPTGQGTSSLGRRAGLQLCPEQPAPVLPPSFPGPPLYLCPPGKGQSAVVCLPGMAALRYALTKPANLAPPPEHRSFCAIIPPALMARFGEGWGAPSPQKSSFGRPAGPCPLRRRKLRASTAGIQGSPSPSKKAPQTQKAPCRHGAGRLVSFASAAGYWAGVSSMSMTRPCSQM